MSRATVRSGIATWFGGGHVAFLSTVYPYPPKTSKESDAFAGEAPGTASGAVGWVHLGEQMERRIAMGGPTNGMKLRLYKAAVLILLRSQHPKAEDAGADHDTLMDAFTARLEAGRTLGGTVFQAGEGDTRGGEDIKVTVDLPKVANGGTTYIWARVEFTAQEILNT